SAGRHLGRARPADTLAGPPRRPPAGSRGQPPPRGRPASRRGARGSRRAALAPPRTMRNALSRLLALRGWSDLELAARAGLDRAYVNQGKNGGALPTVATALAV